MMDELNLRAWLRFSRLEISSRAAYALVKHFGDVQAIFNASEDELARVEYLTDKARAKVLGIIPAAIEKDLHTIEKMAINVVPVTSSEYPAQLKNIYDPPVVLYCKGKIIESDAYSIAIVGSRRASVYGRSIAESIARDLASRGLAVISGGARGIDTSAHKGSLSNGGRTVAVLGCGVDVNYPAENKKLFEAIAENGAVVSEFPFGANPEPWRFPPRNRLISGISMGVLVCQCPEASGALITAGYAAEQGRDVFAVPGNVDDERNRGCHKLIKDGAKLVECVDDILEEFGLEKHEEKHTKQIALPLDSLNDNDAKIVSLLSLEPILIDEIIDKSGLAVSAVTSALTVLEMKGIVKRVPGNAYVRAI